MATQIFLCSPLPGEMIHNLMSIFCKWVGTTNLETIQLFVSELPGGWKTTVFRESSDKKIDESMAVIYAALPFDGPPRELLILIGSMYWIFTDIYHACKPNLNILCTVWLPCWVVPGTCTPPGLPRPGNVERGPGPRADWSEMFFPHHMKVAMTTDPVALRGWCQRVVEVRAQKQEALAAQVGRLLTYNRSRGASDSGNAVPLIRELCNYDLNLDSRGYRHSATFRVGSSWQDWINWPGEFGNSSNWLTGYNPS